LFRRRFDLVATEEKREKGGKVGCWTMEEEGFGGVVDVRWMDVR
jgi:hypothetical protein